MANPFLQALYKATLDNAKDSIAETVPLSDHDAEAYRDAAVRHGLESDTLLVRDHFRPLCEDEVGSMTKQALALVTGTSGIAKSFFALFVLWRVVHDGDRPVFYHYDPYSLTFVVSKGRPAVP